ncbi:DNA polymerase III subunit delta [Campylobacter sp. 2018MI35]|uniref:DNA polymerase III subunit delta n=2 Tax=unclassified Campylobacter TaxID=2593542 RepID=UPI001908A19D|nr:DNA polymerase III subunit delta [Campylobacter sp. 2018MI34]MBK1992451.1 DNA polymerase III subunit delta [Campylobacter sp. 2018MI34]
MYKKDLQLLLNTANFPNFFFLYGADNFQIEFFSELIKEKYPNDEILKIYFEEYNFSKCSDFLSLNSLFSEKKLLEIKCSKKPNTKELKFLIELCKNNADNFFLLEFYDESSRQNELEKIFENNFVRFFKIGNTKEGIELLDMKAKKLNIDITSNALYTLLQSFDENLYLAANELNKFQNLKVNEQTIQTYCYALNTGNFDDFFEKLVKKQDIKKDLENILENFNEMAFINSLNNNFYKLFKILIYSKIHGKIDFKELFGFTPPLKVGSNLSSLAFSIKLKQYKEIFNVLLNTEYEIKTNSKLAKKEFLISNILKLTKILKTN